MKARTPAGNDSPGAWMRSLITGIDWVLAKRFIHSTRNTQSRGITYQPWRVLSRNSTRGMKRKATDLGTDSKAKRQREPEADYCDVIPRKDDQGSAIWPASEQSIEHARTFLKEW